LVLDASVLVKWFRVEGEADLDAARALRAAFTAGSVVLLAPSLIHLELINLAGRRWGWDEERLAVLARSLARLGLQMVEPDLAGVARWTGRGLTACDAAYVAVGESTTSPLVTSDSLILSTAAGIARPLAEWTRTT